MKTIANLTVKMLNKNICWQSSIVTPVFKEESFLSDWTSSTKVAKIGLRKLPLDDLKSSRHQQAELHVIQVMVWNISICSFL